MSVEIKVPISPGELVDKITILEIKSARMTDPAKLANVRTELALLQDTWRTSAYAAHDITAQWAALRAINEKLWDVEDLIRDMLRPMLKTWLDENLPGMVERMVQKEIERITRNGR